MCLIIPVGACSVSISCLYSSERPSVLIRSDAETSVGGRKERSVEVDISSYGFCVEWILEGFGFRLANEGISLDKRRIVNIFCPAVGVDRLKRRPLLLAAHYSQRYSTFLIPETLTHVHPYIPIAYRMHTRNFYESEPELNAVQTERLMFMGQSNIRCLNTSEYYLLL